MSSPGLWLSVSPPKRPAAGFTVEGLAVEALEGRYGPHTTNGDALDAFIGSFDSGDPDWAGTDTHELRAQAASRRQH